MQVNIQLEKVPIKVRKFGSVLKMHLQFAAGPDNHKQLENLAFKPATMIKRREL